MKDAFGYSEKLPENIREIFVWLCQDIASLRDKWDFYLGLFKDAERTTLLSDCAGSSFQIIEESLRTDMIMTICRLSDPPKFLNTNVNLSILRLCRNFRYENTVKQLGEAFLEACKPVRLLRNKKIGHNDLKTRIEPKKNPMPGISKSRIDKIVNTATNFLNTIYTMYNPDCELALDIPIQIGGAEDLIYWLKKAKKMS